MRDFSRRRFLQTGVAASLGITAGVAAAEQGAAMSTPAARPVAKNVTRTLANYVVRAQYEDLPANVRKEGVRTLLNYVGVAVGGSRHETVRNAISALAPFSGPGQAAILGRRERFDIMNAAF